MTEYDFIDPDLPEQREEKRRQEERINRVLREGQELEDYPELRNRALTIEPTGLEVPDGHPYQENSDKVGGENSGIVNRVVTTLKGVLQ